MLKEFNKYVNKFDVSDEKIMWKVEHSLRVYEKNKKNAEKLGFSKDEVNLAGEIGLLHDIGRFRQLEITDSFSDLEGFDHADFGVKYLFDECNIKKYVKDEKDYDIIKFAIKYHNKYRLPKCTDAEMLKQAKLIRDTDKLDILYMFGKLNVFKVVCDDSPISPKVIDAIKKKKLVNNKDVKTHNDEIAVKFALIFDINNDMFIKDALGYIESYYKIIKGEDKFKDILEIIEEYAKERME